MHSGFAGSARQFEVRSRLKCEREAQICTPPVTVLSLGKDAPKAISFLKGRNLYLARILQ
jgi:hypothetical protein